MDFLILKNIVLENINTTDTTSLLYTGCLMMSVLGFMYGIIKKLIRLVILCIILGAIFAVITGINCLSL